MKRHQEELGKMSWPTLMWATIAMNIGGSGRAVNNGNMFHHAQAAQRAQRNGPADHCPAASQGREGRGRRLFMQAAQDVRLGGRPTRTQFEFTLQTPPGELTNGLKNPGEDADAAGAARRRDRSADQSTTLELKIIVTPPRAMHPAANCRPHAVHASASASDAVFSRSSIAYHVDPPRCCRIAGQSRYR